MTIFVGIHTLNSLAKSASRRLSVLFHAKRLFTPTQRLILYKAQVRPLLEYCCHIWGGAASSVLSILDRIQRKAVRFVDSDELTCTLQSLHHRRCVASLSLFYRYYFGRCSQELASSMPLPRSSVRSTRTCTSSNAFQVATPRVRTAAHCASFFHRTASFCNSLFSSVFPATYNLSAFKKAINKLQV